MSTLSKVTSRRLWFVPRFSVWGSPEWTSLDFLVMEEVDAIKSILYGGMGIGESSQSVDFADLVDFRGNSLPPTISNPRVLVRSKSADTAFIVGEETSSGFRIACAENSAGPVIVDLMIVELGE